MNTPIYTCECCGDKTTQPLTFYPAFYPEPAQSVCVECVEETKELLEELRKDEEDIVFKCATCDVAIVRNSKEHDECWTVNGEDWICGDCPHDEDDEHDCDTCGTKCKDDNWFICGDCCKCFCIPCDKVKNPKASGVCSECGEDEITPSQVQPQVSAE